GRGGGNRQHRVLWSPWTRVESSPPGSGAQRGSMTHSRPLAAWVLAAGEGTRMKSSVPKVLHPLCGRPMLLYVIGALEELDLERIVVVVGHGSEQVIKTLQKETDVRPGF